MPIVGKITMRQPTEKSLNIAMPPEMIDFVEHRWPRRFGNRSEYIRHLIREDQQRASTEQLEQALLEGLKSGHPTAMTPADWAEVRKAVQNRLASKKRRAS